MFVKGDPLIKKQNVTKTSLKTGPREGRYINSVRIYTYTKQKAKESY